MKPTPLFIFSLPRSGSTLLQKMLMRHDAIESCSEPWSLLPYLSTFQSSDLLDIRTAYGQELTALALDDFCASLPQGRETYRSHLHDFMIDLYGEVVGPDVTYFLDKTPRYFYIADDALDLFPEAKAILLTRQPLSVASSIVQTWGNGRWNLFFHENDLYDGPRKLAALRKDRGDRLLVVSYENLVTNPERTIREVFAHLDLPMVAEALTDFGGARLEGTMGDPTTRAYTSSVSNQSLDRWKATFATGQRQRWAHRYLDALGDDVIATLGYDMADLHRQVDAIPTEGFDPTDSAMLAFGAAFERTPTPLKWGLEESIRRVRSRFRRS